MPHAPNARSSLLRDRFRGAFLGCLLGDALGRPFEMMTASDARLASSLAQLLASNEPFRYSDDGEMMIGVAESLVRRGLIERADVLATLAKGYDVSRGYGHGMRRALEAVRLGERDVAFSVWPEGSKGNGGAVRVVPVACRYHDEAARLTTFADEATRVTHAHELGRAGAIVHALAIAALIGRADTTLAPSVVLAAVRSPVDAPLGDKLAQVAALLDRGAKTAEGARVLGNGVLAEEAVPLALFVFLRHGPGYLDVVRQAILAGGDTDTVAAMAGALAGAATGYAALPPELLARLENGPRGRDHTLGLADATFAAWEAGDRGDRQPALRLAAHQRCERPIMSYG